MSPVYAGRCNQTASFPIKYKVVIRIGVEPISHALCNKLIDALLHVITQRHYQLAAPNHKWQRVWDLNPRQREAYFSFQD